MTSSESSISNSSSEEVLTHSDGARTINGITIPPPITISAEPTQGEIEAMTPRVNRRRRKRWSLRR